MDLYSILQAVGLTNVVPALMAVHFTASALDASIPQPKPGSHWLPVRKALSLVALNTGFATNASQPPVVTWLQRLVIQLATHVPAPADPTAVGVPPPASPTLGGFTVLGGATGQSVAQTAAGLVQAATAVAEVAQTVQRIEPLFSTRPASPAAGDQTSAPR